MQNSLPVDVVIRLNSKTQTPVIFEVNFGVDEEGVPNTGKVLLISDAPAAQANPSYVLYDDEGNEVSSGSASGYTPGVVETLLVWKNFDVEALALERGRYTGELMWEMLVTGESEKRTENRRFRLYVDY